MLFYLFSKIYIKLLKSADSVKTELTVNLNSQYTKVRFIIDLKN